MNTIACDQRKRKRQTWAQWFCPWHSLIQTKLRSIKRSHLNRVLPNSGISIHEPMDHLRENLIIDRGNLKMLDEKLALTKEGIIPVSIQCIFKMIMGSQLTKVSRHRLTCWSNRTLVVRSEDENNLTTDGTIFFWYSSSVRSRLNLNNGGNTAEPVQ